MVSTCTPVTEEGRHVFEIVGYSKHRGMGHDAFIRSGTFSVGGHHWVIRFHPDGYLSSSAKVGNGATADFISVYLQLLSKDAKVRASCDLSLVVQNTGLSTSVHKTGPRIFHQGQISAFAPQTNVFMKTSELEASGYLQNDHLTIKCVVTVMMEPQVATTEFLNKIDLPPPSIIENLGSLLETEEGADVRFSVGGETIAAHRLVLAMRSPVFKAELYGTMMEGRSQLVTIEDMQPAVFRALLHFIYTDSLPDMVDHEGDAVIEMIRHLIVAADRYAVDGLKLICQSILCEKLNVMTVGTTLALAYQHNCDRLKDACHEFLTASNVMDIVIATPGYKNLKTTCPSALADAFEKAMKRRKT
ncbi:unnamed protein product [Miscanthus lutarioriparius]|uniref:Uncharacterized protein n=1 Tax=Miscanthus lutarioriparius TaxID=422564 RepID=A0A811N796_9POAL|nr:unnamed protein product [Miscanthus lutarioriparius]